MSEDVLSKETMDWIASQRHHLEGVPHEPCLRRALIGDFDRLVALVEKQRAVVEAARAMDEWDFADGLTCERCDHEDSDANGIAAASMALHAALAALPQPS